MPETTEPTLAATREATEAARAANHAAYGAPRVPGSLYDRTGALHDLLSKVEQITRVLSQQTAALPSGPLYSTDETSPGEHLLDAAEHLETAGRAITTAAMHVNEAWSALSPIGERNPE